MTEARWVRTSDLRIFESTELRDVGSDPQKGEEYKKMVKVRRMQQKYELHPHSMSDLIILMSNPTPLEVQWRDIPTVIE